MKKIIYKPFNQIIFKNKHKQFLMLLFLVTVYHQASAIVSNYTFAQSTTTYVPITGTTFLTGAAWDDDTVSVTLPFTFIYNNLSYTSVDISSNGFITMGAGTITTQYGVCGLQISPMNSIAAYGTDLQAASANSKIQYATIGTAPNRQFVVQWTDCDHYVSSGAHTTHWNFQLILNETSNTIQVVWDAVTVTRTMGANTCSDAATESGSVGLLGNATSDINVRKITNGTNTWLTSAAGTQITDVCNMSPSNFPTTGLTYTWTPLPPSPMSFVSCTTVLLNNGQAVGQNTKGSQVLQVQIVTSGSLTPFNVTSLTLSTAGCSNAANDIANAKVNFTGFNNQFDTMNPFGTVTINPNGIYTVNGSATLAEGVNYFWITYDINKTAIIGDSLTGCCTQITGTGALSNQVPVITCPAGYQLVTDVGIWTPVVALGDTSGGLMLLLSDGTVMCKTTKGGTGGYGNSWNKLTPDIHGSYVNGTWSTLAPMHQTRLYFSSQVLKDGGVYVAGGEYGTGGSLAEVYNPLTNIWTIAPAPGGTVSDANSEILSDGRVIQALVTGALKTTKIYNPVTNTYSNGPTCIGIHNESVWLKLPDNSILFVDRASTSSERYIPSLNQWVADATVPVQLYDPFGDETGSAFLLPDGRAFFLGDLGQNAYYTPSGNNSPGIWSVAPSTPNGLGAPDAGAAMMVNGRIICAVSPIPTSANHFPSPTSFYEFNYLTNSFTHINTPSGGASSNNACFITNMLDLPDGTVLYSQQGSKQYYVYSPGGIPLEAGKPTINSIAQNSCNLFTIIGTLFNGISQGASYGDDWQMATNYPVIRLMTDSTVYYARSFNWNTTGVQRGNAADTAQFTLPAGLPLGTYSLVVTANGISSDSVLFTTPAPASLSSTLTPPDICSNTAFNYFPSSNTTGATFTWTRPAVAGIANAAVTIPQTGNPNEILINTTVNQVSVAYDFTTSVGNCLSATEQVVVNVKPSLAITGGTAVCIGDSITLTAVGATGFVWGTGETTASITVIPNVPTTYSVVATNATGCSDSTSQLVNINSLPNPVITANGNTTICQSSTVTLSAGNYNSFQWSNNANGDSISVGTAGIYTVTVTDMNGCKGSDSIVVSVNPLPTVSIGLLPDSVCTSTPALLLTGNPVNGVFSGAGVIGNSFNPSSVSTGSHTIIYSFTDLAGCTNSASHVIYVGACTGFAELGNTNDYINVYPNPANEMINISFKAEASENFLLTLNDLAGKSLREINGNTVHGINEQKFNISAISVGVYTITLQFGNSIYTKMLVVK